MFSSYAIGLGVLFCQRGHYGFLALFEIQAVLTLAQRPKAIPGLVCIDTIVAPGI